MQPKPAQIPLYTFNWVGGGFNQVHARTKAEAIQQIKDRFEGYTPDLSTMKRLTGKRIDDYYASIPPIL